jgi:hypothetical protein
MLDNTRQLYLNQVHMMLQYDLFIYIARNDEYFAHLHI